MSILYRLALAERGGNVILDDVLSRTGVPRNARLVFRDELNGAGSIEFSLPTDHTDVTQDNFEIGNRELYLYRNGSLVWGGKLWVADVRGWEVRLIGYGFWHDLTRRIHGFDGNDYAVQNRDMYDIVWDLVDTTQSRTDGDLGIIRDFATSGRTRKLVICVEERKTIAAAIEDLAAAKNGFDFAIGPDKKMKLWTPRRGTATTVMFTEQNMSDFRFQKDAADIATEVGILGPDEECASPSLYVAVDATARAKYGLLEGTADADDILDDDQREQVAEEELRLRRSPRWQPDLQIQTPLQEAIPAGSIGFNDISIGDTVAVSVERGPTGGFGRMTQTFRVVSRTVEVRRIGFEVITYGVDATVGG